MASTNDPGPAEEGHQSSIDVNDDSHAMIQSIVSPDQRFTPLTFSQDTKADPTTIRNQIILQRSQSRSKSHQPRLSNQLSIKSDSSHEADLSHSGILTVISQPDQTHDRARGNSTGTVTDGVNACSLSKSLSTSARSIKSVKSVGALGIHPFGSLRVHSGEKETKDHSPACLLSGDVVVVTGMPSDSIFGFDTISFTLGKDGQFEGLKNLPSGPHFIYGGFSSELSPRNGFWIMSQRRTTGEHGEIFVKRWDSYNETLEDEISDAEVRIQKENVSNVFQHLIPYTTRAAEDTAFTLPQSSSPVTTLGLKDPKMWNRLTFAIKGAMLTRMTGHVWNKWQVSSNDDSKPMEVKPTDAKTNTLLDMASDRSEQIAGKDSVLTFAFPRKGVTFSHEVTGRERTEQAMDTSAHILSVIHERCTYEDADEVLGELQFCYISGVFLGNMTCQEQWAHVVKVIFRAFRLAMDMPAFFQKLIETVHAQLIYDEEGVEGSVFDHDVYLQDELKIILTVFKSRLNEQLLAKGIDLTDEQNRVGKAFEALESWLWKWGWDLRGNYLRSGKIQLEDGELVDAELNEFEAEDERGEYAPVIVDLEEDGREKGLIRW